LVVALVVTLLVLPLLVLDLMGGGGDNASDTEVATPDVPQPSLVVAVDPSEVPTTVTTEAPVVTTPPTTAAAVTTTTKAPTTTTTAPARPKATTTTAPPAPAPPPASSAFNPTASEASFLACVRFRESRGIYTAVDPTGQFMGAYQIYQGGWDAVARSIGRGDLVGVRPHTAAPIDQDIVALAMLRQYGTKPWGGYCG
jgi:hypothetical protein